VNLVALVQAVGGPWVYLVIGVAAFLESAAFVGLLVPGETVVLLGGVVAALGRVDLFGVIAVAAVGAVAGDQVGYVVGRAFGPSLRRGRLSERIGVRRRAEELVARRGGLAVFLGRWVGVLRAVVPVAAGAVGVPRAVFTVWNVIGGVSWAGAVVGVGYLAGAAWPTVQHDLGIGALVLTGVVAAVIGGAALFRRRRRAAAAV